MSGVMLTALRIQQQARDAGFDWPSAQESLQKVQEELNEISFAIKQGNPKSIEEEYGDLLLAMTNLSLHLNIDAMQCLKKAIDKFNGRYQFMMGQLKDESIDFLSLSVNKKQSLWQKAKKKVRYKN